MPTTTVTSSSYFIPPQKEARWVSLISHAFRTDRPESSAYSRATPSRIFLIGWNAFPHNCSSKRGENPGSFSPLGHDPPKPLHSTRSFHPSTATTQHSKPNGEGRGGKRRPEDVKTLPCRDYTHLDAVYPVLERRTGELQRSRIEPSLRREEFNAHRLLMPSNQEVERRSREVAQHLCLHHGEQTQSASRRVGRNFKGMRRIKSVKAAMSQDRDEHSRLDLVLSIVNVCCWFSS